MRKRVCPLQSVRASALRALPSRLPVLTRLNWRVIFTVNHHSLLEHKASWPLRGRPGASIIAAVLHHDHGGVVLRRVGPAVVLSAIGPRWT